MTLIFAPQQVLAQFMVGSSNSTSGPIPDNQATCMSQVERTFSISTSFFVGDLDVTLAIDHPNKSDIRVTLESPAGSIVTLIDDVGGANDDFNVRLDDEARAPLANIDHDANVTRPEFTRLPVNALSTFDGQPGNGTWILRVCDQVNQNSGTLLFSRLDLTSGPAASPLVVTSTADTNNLGTLRFAINHANTNAADDAITFNIPGTGPHLISLTSALPIITDSNVSIDGTTQSGASCGNLWAGTQHNIMVQINGATSTTRGLRSSADNILIRGLSLTGAARGVEFSAGSSNSALECSYLGLNPDGTSNANIYGILTLSAGTRIGGLSSGQGNVISGNRWGLLTQAPSTELIVQGNFIGTDPTGLMARSNTELGLGNVSGASTVTEIRNNLISGNNYGFQFQSDDTWTGVAGADFFIADNYIGTDRTGQAALANTLDGINFEAGNITNAVIGGTSISDRNIISGNGGYGIKVTDQSNITLLGNYIGLGANGTIPLGNQRDGIIINSSTNINIGNGSNNGRNIISSNVLSGINLTGTIDDIIIDGNYIGLAANGSTARGNGANFAGSGIAFSAATSDGDIIQNNIISANGDSGISELDSTISNLSITNNYIGTDATGLLDRGNDYYGIAWYGEDVISTTIGAPGAGNVIAGSEFSSGIETYSGSHTIQGNLIGLGANGTTLISNGTWGVRLFSGPVPHIVGGTAPGEGNIIAGAGNGYSNLLIQDGAEALVSGNTLRESTGGRGLDVANNGTIVTFHDNIVTGNSGDGINVGSGAQLYAYDNIITANTGNGIELSSPTAKAAIYSNIISGNSGLGIDLSGNGATINDGGDPDSGPNDLLNFPLINSFSTNGTSYTAYDISLDVPSNPEGYRVEFFKNTNLETYGQGEIYLGSIDVTHTGGNLNFTGSFTSSESVSSGDYISATTTRKTGAASFDITSEFAETQTATQLINPLIVENTNDSGTGSLREAILFANSNPAEDNIRFNIPTTDSRYNSTRGVWRIQLASALPALTDDAITIDGTSQTSNQGNTNSGVLIPAATAGVNDTNVPAVPAPEIEIEGLGGSSIALDINGSDNVVLRGLAILDFGTAIRLRGGSSNALIDQLAIGSRAHSPADPGGGNRVDNGVFLSGNSNSVLIQNSLIANMEDGRAISAGADSQASGNSITVEGVHFINNGLDLNFTNGAIELLRSLSPTLILRGNRFIAPSGATDAGVEINPFDTGGTACVACVIEDNSFDGFAFALGVFGDETTGIVFQRNIVENSLESGIVVGPWVGGLVQDNRFTSSVENGIGFFEETARVAIVGNSFSGNGQLAIDFDFDGVTLNDSNDVDNGPNERLNFPVINSFATDGSTAIEYDFDLDAPSAANGYRIDFFKNSVVDPTGHGEGEIYLGSVDIVHGGGDLNFTGTFIANAPVAVNDNVAATTIRKSGPSTYDITSEFSSNSVSIFSDPAVLAVTKTVDSLIAGDYFLPGNDVIYTFSVVNQGGGSVTEDSIVLIDLLPPELKFFYGDYDGPGPSSDVIGFEDIGSSLTFNPATDALYSDATTKPTSLAECDYTPTMGYDENVRFVCFNPKGEMQGGDPDPNFTLRFRAGIK